MNAHEIGKALAAPRCLISVMGPHAGEGSEGIFKRKIEDISRSGMTLWVVGSQGANPHVVQDMCKNGDAYVLFIEPAASNGARETTADDSAREYSADSKEWHAMPDIGPVTGKIGKNTCALVFDHLVFPMNDVSVDLWDYADFADPSKPIKTILGRSTICAIRKDMRGCSGKMASHVRKVIAIGRLAKPYGVWLRK